MRAPVAQLDRASASGVEGREFESRRVYHLQKYQMKAKNGNSNFRFDAVFLLHFLTAVSPPIFL